jgi:hypothetical protein
MISIETISGMGEGRIKENDGGGAFKYDIYRAFMDATVYPPVSTTLKTKYTTKKDNMKKSPKLST